MPVRPDWWNERSETKDSVVFRMVCTGDEYRMHKKPKDKVVLDVGAHVGSFSYLAVCRHAREVHAFEPNPENYDLLVKNMIRFPEVHCYKQGIVGNDGVGVGKLRSHEPTETWSGISNNGTIDIDCVAIDDVLNRIGKVDIMKIDCEGSEFPIFRTLRQWDKIGEICGEFHDGACGGDRWELKWILEKAGFKVELLDIGKPWGNFWAIR